MNHARAQESLSVNSASIIAVDLGVVAVITGGNKVNRGVAAKRRKRLLRGRIGEDFRGNARDCFVSFGAQGFVMRPEYGEEQRQLLARMEVLSEAAAYDCGEVWFVDRRGIGPRVEHGWERLWTESVQGKRCEPCSVHVLSILYEPRECRNSRGGVRSEDFECSQCAFDTGGSRLTEQGEVDFALQSERRPRHEATPPGRWLVLHPRDQVWQSIGADSEDCSPSFSRPTWGQLVILAYEHRLDSVFFDPEGELFSLVGWFRRPQSNEDYRCCQQHQERYSNPQLHVRSMSREC